MISLPAMVRTISALLVLGLGGLCTGCEEKKPSSEALRVDAGSPDKYATADPKLANALQAAASASASPNGPPPEGIFEEGAADRRHPAGVPTKVDLISEGSAPRINLTTADASGDPRTRTFGRARMETLIQSGPRNAVVVDFDWVLGPAKKDEGGLDWTVAEIKKAAPSEQQLGQLPPGTDKDVASLDGSLIRIKMTADGRESELQVQLSKSARPELARFTMNAAEALLFATVPVPPKPVGVGAQWIAETRMPLSGLDVIAYRAYRVKEIDGDRVHLTLNVKAYAASTDVKLQGVPKGATLQQFDAQSQGELELVRGEVMARKSDVQQHAVMVFQAPGAAGAPSQPGGNMLTAQVQSQATFVRGDDLRVTAK